MPKRNFTPIGEYLKSCRIKAGVTQKEIADAFKLTSGQLISNVERSACNPPAKMIRKWVKIAKANPHHVLELMSEQSNDYWREALGLDR